MATENSDQYDVGLLDGNELGDSLLSDQSEDLEAWAAKLLHVSRKAKFLSRTRDQDTAAYYSGMRDGLLAAMDRRADREFRRECPTWLRNRIEERAVAS